METKLIISDLRIDLIVGVRDAERENSQTLSVDIEINQDIAPSKDVLANVIDYSALVQSIKTTLQNVRPKTIEYAASIIANMLDAMPKVKEYTVRVHKHIDDAGYRATIELRS